MISFKEYSEKIHKPGIKKVLFGIERGSNQELLEAISLDYHSDYVGPAETHPINQGFSRVFKGIYSHPDHPNKRFLFMGTSHPTVFETKSDGDDDAIIDHMDSIKGEHRKKLYNAIDDLTKHYNEKEYSDKHKEHIERYTDVYSNVNSLLLQSGADAFKGTENTGEHIKHLDSALSHKSTPDDMVVYTGTNLDHANVLRHANIVHHPSYLSTSISLNKAQGFARSKEGDIVKIHVPKGHHGLFPNTMSRIPGEFEFILPRDTYLHIDHSKRQFVSDDLRKSTGGAIMHHATIVDKKDLGKYE